MIADAQLRRLGLPESAVRLYGPLIRATLTAALLTVIAAQAIVCWRIAETTWRVRRMGDFAVFYESAGRARRGEAPYALVPTLEGRFARPPNLTPPHVVAAMVPLTFLPPGAALAVWSALGMLSAILAIGVIFREAGIRVTMRSVIWTTAAVLGAAPTGALIFAAQMTWLLWWPAASAWAYARRGRWTMAAALLGVLASIKLFLGLFGVVFLLLRLWRAAAVLVATAAVCLAAGWAMLGAAAFAGWIDALRAVSWAGHVWNGSLFGLVQRALIGSPHAAWPLAPLAVRPELVLPVWALLTAAVLLVVSRAVRHSPPAAPAFAADRLFARTLTTSLLVSPLGWLYYDFLIAAPFVALAAAPAWRSRWRGALMAFAGAALVCTPGMLGAWQPSGLATVTIGSLYFWALLALWLASVPR